MQRLLRMLGTRYGLALLAAVVVLAVVGVFRGVAGTQPAPRSGPVPDAGSASPLPADDDDGLDTTESPPAPVTSPGAPSPESVAASFATAWLHSTGVTADQWRRGLKPYATDALLTKLKDTDPAGVPAERITGPAELIPRDVGLVEAVIPVDSGRLRLRLLATDGRWLVDGVDWERA
jgi:hypothetical protein